VTAVTPRTDTAPPDRGPTPLGVGVVVWLASELMFFSGLFAAWFTLRANASTWPPEGVELDVPRTAVATAVLVASSGTMHLAHGAAKHDERSRSMRWLVVTAVLGLLFLANTVAEWIELDFRLDDHAYGSIFYLLTGFHALHVLGGVLFMGVVAAIIGGRSRAPAGGTVDACAAYWHFVDVVWIAVFTVVYLIG
jgi:cytochrome c oxidase subunit III